MKAISYFRLTTMIDNFSFLAANAIFSFLAVNAIKKGSYLA